MSTKDQETFIPYNPNKLYITVNFVELKKTEQGMFHDIMVVEYQGEEYDLIWDEYYSYYTGKVGTDDGFIP